MPTSSKLQIPHPLPRTGVEPAIRNRHRDASADQRGLDVRGHVIQSLGRMSVEISLLVFGRDAVEGVGHVFAVLGIQISL